MAKDWINIGKVTKSEQVQNIVEYTCTNGSVRLSVLENSVLRVVAKRPEQSWEKVSYSVEKVQSLSKIVLAEGVTEDWLAAPFFKIQVMKSPFCLNIYTLEDKLILGDDPSFSISWDGDEVTNYKKLHDHERFLGLGEKTQHLDKRGHQFTNWNTDFFGYQAESDPIYASLPFYLGVKEEMPYGVFLDNSSRTTFNFGCSNDRFSFFRADKGLLDYYFFFTGNIAGILTQYTQLTGRHQMPPMWSLGFQQCRYSYYPDTEVLRIAKTFREKGIPGDVIYLDIHYMQDYKVFTWNEKTFSHPKELLEELKALGFKVVVILDPGIKVEAGYEPYDSALADNLFAMYPDGSPYSGEVWPGWCHFPDYTKQETREWWAQRVSELRDLGVTGFWNDMNEPAAWGQKMPDLIQFHYEGQGASHKEARNIYGMQMTRATQEGLVKSKPQERPFVLTRAAFAGSQRYCAIWTGDNCSSNDHLLLGAKLVSNLGLGGMAFAGNDVGGFIGDCWPDLYIRWIQVGAFTPLFRMHTMINSKTSEPWSYGEEATEIGMNYIKLRYQLMAYMYSHFHEYTRSGLPIIRSLAIDHWKEWQIFDFKYDSQFFCGQSLLICPIEGGKEFIKLYLPVGIWYDFFNDKILNGNIEYLLEYPKDKLPIFAKAGNLVIQNNVGQHTGELDFSFIAIHVYNSDFAGDTFAYYMDDGMTTDHEKSIFYRRNIVFNGSGLDFGAVEGTYRLANQKWRVFLHGFGDIKAKTETMDFSWVVPISNFDPFIKGTDMSKTIVGLKYFDIEDKVEGFSVAIK